MGFGRSVARCATLSGFFALLVAGVAEAQVQTAAQQGCINALNKSGQKVAQTQGKENISCVKDAGLGKLPSGMDASECLTADRKGKVAAASVKTTEGETLKCTEAPSFGFTGSTVANSVAVAQEVALTSDVFGSPVKDAISTDPVESKCQSGVTKSYEKYVATFLKQFNSCKKTGLKDGSISSAATLASCVGDDPKDKISGALTKVGDAITKSCTGVTLAAVFPGECAGQAGSAATLASCLANAADCRACIVLRDMDSLLGTDSTPLVNCDTFDDGIVNGSCEGCGNGVVESHEVCDDGPGNTDVAPDACRTTCVNAHCGDGVVDYADECDDGNNIDGDGCNASCGCEPGNPSAKCQDMACPTSGRLVLWAGTSGVACTDNTDCAVGACDVGLGVCTTATALDTGFTGIAHDSDINDQVVLRNNLICSGPFAGGPQPCGTCTVTGIDPSTGYCRCANDNRTQCDEPFALDGDDCGGGICNCYFGPPLPLSSGNTPACVVNRFAVDVSGTVNVDTGEGEGAARLASVVYLGENVLAPCPSCGGTCTGPANVCAGTMNDACASDADCQRCTGDQNVACTSNVDCTGPQGTCSVDRVCGRVGESCGVDVDCDSTFTAGNGVCGNFDPTAGDGLRGGTCFLGANDGQACDVDVYSENFPADPTPGNGGAGMALDCWPDTGLNVSGSGLKIALDSTTGVVSLPLAAITCGYDVAPELCPCGVCTLDNGTTCTSNADCTGIGVCGKLGNAPRQNTCANDGICNDIGGGKGQCNQGSLSYCDGTTRSDGTGFIQCSDNADCEALGPTVGDCTLSTPQPCFLDPITATGVQDPNTPVSVAAFCVPPTGNSGINTVAGLPGPGRVMNAAEAETYCGSNPAVPYTPGVGGCPP